MLKSLITIIVTIFCAGIAIIPESIMYFIWSVVSPQTVIEKILMVILFWVGGTGLCVIAAILAIFLWILIVKIIWD